MRIRGYYFTRNKCRYGFGRLYFDLNIFGNPNEDYCCEERSKQKRKEEERVQKTEKKEG